MKALLTIIFLFIVISLFPKVLIANNCNIEISQFKQEIKELKSENIIEISDDEIQFFIDSLTPINCKRLELVKRVFYKYQINSILNLIRIQLLSQGEAGIKPYIYFIEVEFHGCKQAYLKQLIDGSFYHDWHTPYGYREIFFSIEDLERVERQPAQHEGYIFPYKLDIIAGRSSILIKKAKFNETPNVLVDFLFKKVFLPYAWGIVNPFTGNNKEFQTNKFTFDLSTDNTHYNSKSLAEIFAKRFIFVKKACDYLTE